MVINSMIIRKDVKFVNLASSLGKNQGCQFSGKSLNSGHGNLFSGHMFHFFVYKLNNFR